ncbi:alanine racemase [Sulfurimonas sp. SAG-AH-194-C20]|nr:alanine racemase [Sulfurimonas sp. SAG-AH-194-C20]MDF1878243.1 alanine racemase [Sulfurimonas sp. SAG-AH-194-C20]
MASITLSKANFFHNLDIIKEQTQAIEKIALVLKDNAYGHGLCEMAKLAKEYGITRAVVRSNEEAQTIEEFFEYVLVLADTPKIPSKKIRYTINDIKKISEFAKDSLVELKIDTGMSRNGIASHEMQEALSLIKEQGLNLEAVFTHHACADELSGEYEKQKEKFEKIKKELSKYSNLRFHSCNSAALFREENFDEDMVRVGIGAYGCLELPFPSNAEELRPVLSLYAQKNSSREVNCGDCVGYGGTFSAKKSVLVSNYDFGYADGFLRSCAQGYKTPDNTNIAGRISMDNSSFVSDKEELLIFNDARDVAKYAGTISYEVLTALKPHLKRRLV